MPGDAVQLVPKGIQIATRTGIAKWKTNLLQVLFGSHFVGFVWERMREITQTLDSGESVA